MQCPARIAFHILSPHEWIPNNLQIFRGVSASSNRRTCNAILDWNSVLRESEFRREHNGGKTSSAVAVYGDFSRIICSNARTTAVSYAQLFLKDVRSRRLCLAFAKNCKPKRNTCAEQGNVKYSRHACATAKTRSPDHFFILRDFSQSHKSEPFETWCTSDFENFSDLKYFRYINLVQSHYSSMRARMYIQHELKCLQYVNFSNCKFRCIVIRILIGKSNVSHERINSGNSEWERNSNIRVSDITLFFKQILSHVFA